MPKAPAITLEVLPKETATPASTVTVTVLQADHMASAILADIDSFEHLSKEAAFIALRIGLRLIFIRDNSSYGTLSKFIRTNFKGKHSDSTLFRYIGAAEDFAKDTGLLDKKTHKLTNGQAITPILETQLELFTDPTAKFDGAMKKLIAWVGERGLSDLYKARKKAAPKDPDEDEASPPKPKTADQLAQEAEEEMNTFANLMDGWFLAAHHTRISKDQRTILDAAFEAARTKLKAVK